MPDLLFLVPSEKFIEMVCRICNDYTTRTGIQIKVECLTIAEAITADFSDSIVIARGYMAYMLKRVKPEASVVEIPMSVYDILEAARCARKETGAKRLAFIAADSEDYRPACNQNLSEIRSGKRQTKMRLHAILLQLRIDGIGEIQFFQGFPVDLHTPHTHMQGQRTHN